MQPIASCPAGQVTDLDMIGKRKTPYREYEALGGLQTENLEPLLMAIE